MVFCLFVGPGRAAAQEIAGARITPHHVSDALRWRRPPGDERGALVQLFVRRNADGPGRWGPAHQPTFDGRTAEQLVADGAWAWHDTPAVWLEQDVRLPAEHLLVLSFNGKSDAWGVGSRHAVRFPGEDADRSLTIEEPAAWLSSVTFLARPVEGEQAPLLPDEIVGYVRNASHRKLTLRSLRLWLSADGSPRVFRLAEELQELNAFPADGVVDGHGLAGFCVTTPPLPLHYAVVELRAVWEDQQEVRLWSRLRVKREQFDISGGWVASDVKGRNSLTLEPYLKTLRRMHVNTGQIEEVAGYTDNPELYSRYPLKRFNRLADLARYDTDAMLPTIHAVEFIGEPQYGGGRPIPPQEVWSMLAPYERSRLPTSVTLSEERTWRYYAGLSDYPHYDAYRVIAPAADSWRSYDRWDGESIRWGAPLETIGDMTRSLREHSRPAAIAYWSQGAHDGWGGFGRSRRGSPTPDELRSQAWHGLANRITSLYWFNLSLKSLVKFPDLIEPITRVNREIRVVQELLLRGDAWEHRRIFAEGRPQWDLNSIAAADSMLLVAHDLAYRPDLQQQVFRFEAREARLAFQLAPWLKGERLQVFALGPDGPRDVDHAVREGEILVEDRIRVNGLYLATRRADLREYMQAEWNELVQSEQAVGFDPGGKPADLEQLRALLDD